MKKGTAQPPLLKHKEKNQARAGIKRSRLFLFLACRGFGLFSLFGLRFGLGFFGGFGSIPAEGRDRRSRITPDKWPPEFFSCRRSRLRRGLRDTGRSKDRDSLSGCRRRRGWRSGRAGLSHHVTALVLRHVTEISLTIRAILRLQQDFCLALRANHYQPHVNSPF
jgi:hypothetical protein